MQEVVQARHQEVLDIIETLSDSDSASSVCDYMLEKKNSCDFCLDQQSLFQLIQAGPSDILFYLVF